MLVTGRTWVGRPGGGNRPIIRLRSPRAWAVPERLVDRGDAPETSAIAQRRVSFGIGRLVPEDDGSSARFTRGATAMSTLGWMSVSRMTRCAPTWGRAPRRPAKYKIQPMLESLEEMVLLSPGSPVINGASVQLDDSTGNVSATASTEVTTAPQTLTIRNQPNDTADEPPEPAAGPGLATVRPVAGHADRGDGDPRRCSSRARSRRRTSAQSSGTTITANLNGNYVINGLNQTIARTVTAPSQSITGGREQRRQQ